jgi:anti-anti-sigma factor
MSVPVKVVKSPESLDSSNVAQFTNEIESLLEKGVKILLLDLKNVTFMSSSGLMALIYVLKIVKAAGCTLFIASASETVRILLEITGLDNFFATFYPKNETNFGTEQFVKKS